MMELVKSIFNHQTMTLDPRLRLTFLCQFADDSFWDRMIPALILLNNLLNGWFKIHDFDAGTPESRWTESLQ